MNAVETIVKKVASGVDSADFSASNWAYRRNIIMIALMVCGICVLGIALVVIGALARIAWVGASPTYDANLLRLAETLVWAMLTFAASIIGTYVFGANFDTKDFRKNFVEMQSRGMSTTVESKVTTVAAPTVAVVPDAGDQPLDELQVQPATVTVETKKSEGPAG